MAPGPHQAQKPLGVAPAPGQVDFPFAGQEEPGEGVGVAHQLLRGAVEHHPAPFPARPRPHVHHKVGLPDGLRVVLHHDHGVAQVPEVLQGVEEFLGIPGVEADAGLIQDVEDAGEFRADLGGQADALGLSPGQGGGGPVQAEVIQPHFRQKTQAFGDFLQDPPGDLRLAGRKFEAAEPRRGPGSR